MFIPTSCPVKRSSLWVMIEIVYVYLTQVVDPTVQVRCWYLYLRVSETNQTAHYDLFSISELSDEGSFFHN